MRDEGVYYFFKINSILLLLIMCLNLTFCEEYDTIYIPFNDTHIDPTIITFEGMTQGIAYEYSDATKTLNLSFPSLNSGLNYYYVDFIYEDGLVNPMAHINNPNVLKQYENDSVLLKTYVQQGYGTFYSPTKDTSVSTIPYYNGTKLEGLFLVVYSKNTVGETNISFNLGYITSLPTNLENKLYVQQLNKSISALFLMDYGVLIKSMYLNKETCISYKLLYNKLDEFSTTVLAPFFKESTLPSSITFESFPDSDGENIFICNNKNTPITVDIPISISSTNLPVKLSKSTLYFIEPYFTITPTNESIPNSFFDNLNKFLAFKYIDFANKSTISADVEVRFYNGDLSSPDIKTIKITNYVFNPETNQINYPIDYNYYCYNLSKIKVFVHTSGSDIDRFASLDVKTYKPVYKIPVNITLFQYQHVISSVNIEKEFSPIKGELYKDNLYVSYYSKSNTIYFDIYSNDFEGVFTKNIPILIDGTNYNISLTISVLSNPVVLKSPISAYIYDTFEYGISFSQNVSGINITNVNKQASCGFISGTKYVCYGYSKEPTKFKDTINIYSNNNSLMKSYSFTIDVLAPTISTTYIKNSTITKIEILNETSVVNNISYNVKLDLFAGKKYIDTYLFNSTSNTFEIYCYPYDLCQYLTANVSVAILKPKYRFDNFIISLNNSVTTLYYIDGNDTYTKNVKLLNVLNPYLLIYRDGNLVIQTTPKNGSIYETFQCNVPYTFVFVENNKSTSTTHIFKCNALDEIIGTTYSVQDYSVDIPALYCPPLTFKYNVTTSNGIYYLTINTLLAQPYKIKIVVNNQTIFTKKTDVSSTNTIVSINSNLYQGDVYLVVIKDKCVYKQYLFTIKKQRDDDIILLFASSLLMLGAAIILSENLLVLFIGEIVILFGITQILHWVSLPTMTIVFLFVVGLIVVGGKVFKK